MASSSLLAVVLCTDVQAAPGDTVSLGNTVNQRLSLHDPRVIKEFLAFAWYGRNFTLGDFITFLTQIVTFCLLKFPLQTEVSLSFSKCREYI